MPKNAAQKIQPVVIDLNGTNEKGEPTFAGYTVFQATQIACESSSPNALEWLKAWWNADLTAMNTTPESY
ncbi:hypothetical protein B7L88_gp132 [Rhizobium phage RHEph10]|uniref:hypothetical protein n=1 Tax=Rhizobium phage RHEph10 TaxID=1220717 RepID=UPI0002AB699C|nr:hypothetical protein B7L88_gp132 [Rhizobium phage RHEph10]AGC36156.1 hypothetical protein RHEph10_gp113 [Rhizobium phage RHEph10]